jgi:hypothetical protein
MKTTNHTPGPWVVTFGKYDASIHTDVTISRISDEAHAWKANAHLIASAPDLLSALRFLLADYIAINGETLTGSSVPADMARAAIAKAEGVA